LLFVILLQVVPESPRWLLLKKGKTEEAIAILKVVLPDTYLTEIEEIKNNKNRHPATSNTSQLFSRRYRFPVFLAVSFAVFNQVSGINAIIYYAPRIFEMTVLGRNSSLLSTVGIGAVNFIFTLIAINFIDRIGRKTLM